MALSRVWDPYSHHLPPEPAPEPAPEPTEPPAEPPAPPQATGKPRPRRRAPNRKRKVAIQPSAT